MQFGLARHHTGAHRVSQAPAGGGIGVGFAHFGVIGQAEIVVDAPANHFFAFENHAITQFAFELGKHVVTFGYFGVLAQGAGLLENTIEQIHYLKIIC